MALAGTDTAYLQARSGIARAGASRSNYVVPLDGVVTVDGLIITRHIRYGSLRVTMAINEEPDTAAFDVLLTDAPVQSAVVVGADVLIGLGGATDNVQFGGRILTAQTSCGPVTAPRICSVLCADYLQVLDSEYFVTYEWPPQSATVTIKDLVMRFANKPGGVAISPDGVAAGLPTHATVGVSNERFSTVLRRLVTMFPAGGGFYVDPLRVLHVWQGLSEPGVIDPTPVTLASPQLKTFAETVDGSQLRDAVLVEGLRTTAPIGSPGPVPGDTGRNVRGLPVLDASILDRVGDAGVDREVRIGTQRYVFRYADGPWNSPAGTPQATTCDQDVPYDPAGAGDVVIYVGSTAPFTGRKLPCWARVNEQWLQVVSHSSNPTPRIYVSRTGFGALISAIKYGDVVSVCDSLSSGTLTGRYDAPGALEAIRPQPIDADVVMTVRSASGYGVHEQIVQDGRYSRSGAAARGTKEVTDFQQALITIDFDTVDLNAKPGRRQVYHLDDGALAPLAGEYMILSAELTWPKWGDPPRRRCRAAEVHPAQVVDAWLVDKR